MSQDVFRDLYSHSSAEFKQYLYLKLILATIVYDFLVKFIASCVALYPFYYSFDTLRLFLNAFNFL